MPKLAAELETLKTNICLCVGTEKGSAYSSSSVSPLRNKKEAKSQLIVDTLLCEERQLFTLYEYSFCTIFDHYL